MRRSLLLLTTLGLLLLNAATPAAALSAITNVVHDDPVGLPFNGWGDGGDGERGQDAPGASRLLFSELMYNPASGEDAWEWVELYNPTSAPVDLAGYVFDDANGIAHERANVSGGTVPARGTAVLYNADAVSATDMAAAWGPGVNLVPVTGWSTGALNNGGDQVGLWERFAHYEGDHEIQSNAIVSLRYGDAGAWPADDGSGSIYLTDLAADASNGARWALSEIDAATPAFAAYRSRAAGGNSGADVGSPGPGFTDGSPPKPEARLIHEVQGNGETSPLTRQMVTVEAIVVGDFQEGDADRFGTALGGFYMQEEAKDTDADPSTSEGLFVFTGDASAEILDVVAGDLVRITGEVREYAGLTELAGVSSFERIGTVPLPAPARIALPVEAHADLEHYEGMRVRFPQQLVISEFFDFDRFGEIVLTKPPEDLSRPYQPTSYVEPGPQAAAVEAANRLRRITLDDGRTTQNPDPARHPNGQPFTLDNRFRGGDRVEGATGILSYRFDAYRLQPTQGARFIKANPRPEQPAAVGGRLKVATFNVLNYFNGDGRGGGFPTARGANTREELERQTAKIVSAILGLRADVVGLIEIENDPAGATSALDDLVEALNDRAGEKAFAHVRTGRLGTDEIKVALLYRPQAVTPVGDYAVLDAPGFTDPGGLGEQKNRPALAQTFREEATQGRFTVTVSHFKSKGSSCGPGDDDPQQGNCNRTRTRAAKVLTDWLATDPTDADEPDVLIIGDLNAYDEEDPIGAIKAGPDGEAGTEDDYTGLLEQQQGEFAYSYVFDGQFGHLDYALSSTTLAEQVTGTTAWPLNADEPDILNYDMTAREDAQDALYEPNAYRASDHDPVLVGLDLTPPSSSVLLNALIEKVKMLESGARGFLNALSALLEATQRCLERGSTEAARGQLAAFIQRVETHRGNSIGEADAEELTDDAALILERIRAEEEADDAQTPPADGTEQPDSTGSNASCPEAALPESYELGRSYPNPFRKETWIRFALPEATAVRLEVYDLLGRRVAVLIDEAMPAGQHEAHFEGSLLSSGLYLYRLRAGAFAATGHMTLLR